MNITIANLSRQIFAADFQGAVSAIGRQVAEHFQPEWGTGATLKGVWVSLVGKKAPIQKGADAVIYLGDSSEDPTTGVEDAEGYHSANNKGIPYGFVYLDICAKAKEAWSFTLSHEVLELLADPDTALTVAGPQSTSLVRSTTISKSAIRRRVTTISSTRWLYRTLSVRSITDYRAGAGRQTISIFRCARSESVPAAIFSTRQEAGPTISMGAESRPVRRRPRKRCRISAAMRVGQNGLL
jgi:hypothetical protein